MKALSTKKIAFVCASNQNRSMEAHYQSLDNGFKANAHSFGTNTTCKLPGPREDQPNIFPFGTPYSTIYEKLKSQDPQLYTQNGLLKMLERNIKVKTAPQRWQDETKLHLDIVITFEERVFDIVVDDINSREISNNEPVHVFDIATKDNPEEATVGGAHAIALLKMLDEDEDWEDNLDEIISKFQKQRNKEILHSIHFY